MADNTKIEWADATLNYVNGCARVSPGCVNCYAERLAATRLRGVPSRAGLAEMTTNGPRWTGLINIDDRALDQALRWRRPRRIFWNAHGDLFHESVPDAAIDRLFAVCALTPHHTHMILTKRAGRMREYMNGSTCDGARRFHIADAAGRMMDDGDHAHSFVAAGCDWPLPNVWLGVSVEDQRRADERIPDLLATPAAVRFISAEPLLGPINLRHRRENGDEITTTSWLHGTWQTMDGDHMRCGHLLGKAKLDWVIAGGESGPGARPMHPDWARSLRDQCAAAGVPFLFKQWGEWAPVCEMSEDLNESIYHPAPAHSPEAARRCKVDACVLHRDGTRFDGRAMYERGAFWQGTGAMTMFAVSKAKAGRLLDGVEHNAFPEVRHD